MKENAEVHGFAHNTKVRFSLVSLAALVALLACLGGTALAAPIGKDGSIHACYRVKGKPKGTLRVVSNARVRCRRGERKVAWSIASSGGLNGQGGAAGQQGQNGTNSATSTSKEAVLQTQVAGLTLKVESLEGLLDGVTKNLSGLLGKVNGLEGLLQGVEPGDLTNVLGTLEGVTNGKLQETIGALPLLGEVCTQASSLTSTLNQVLNLVSLLGGLDPINAIACPPPTP